MKPAALTLPLRKPKRSTGQRRRPPTSKTSTVRQPRSPNVRQSASNAKPQEVKTEERVSPFSVLLSEHGIERSRLGPITNGELMRIAEVDIATMHGWQYLNRSLPTEAISRLTDHFRCMVIGSTAAPSPPS